MPEQNNQQRQNNDRSPDSRVNQHQTQPQYGRSFAISGLSLTFSFGPNTSRQSEFSSEKRTVNGSDSRFE